MDRNTFFKNYRIIIGISSDILRRLNILIWKYSKTLKLTYVVKSSSLFHLNTAITFFWMYTIGIYNSKLKNPDRYLFHTMGNIQITTSINFMNISVYLSSLVKLLNFNQILEHWEFRNITALLCQVGRSNFWSIMMLDETFVRVFPSEIVSHRI